MLDSSIVVSTRPTIEPFLHLEAILSGSIFCPQLVLMTVESLYRLRMEFVLQGCANAPLDFMDLIAHALIP